MFNGFLTIFLKYKISLHQHGFFPKRGCLTAWRQILQSDLLSKTDILEFDLTSFFDTIEIPSLRYALYDMKVPK
jgi:hypothetical protein